MAPMGKTCNFGDRNRNKTNKPKQLDTMGRGCHMMMHVAAKMREIGFALSFFARHLTVVPPPPLRSSMSSSSGK